MIGRKADKIIEGAVEPKGFDDFELRLGDIMRGERATLGKSLLDVQRELRIKASYIAAIENCDPEAFDTPGFIAGYVRSYARYLNMDPDRAFAVFCSESGFSVAHGMSAEASVIKKTSRVDRAHGLSAGDDIFAKGRTPFAPATSESMFTGIEPGAIGSSLVLLALIGAIGFGGWSVLQEVQRVQVAPVDQTPVVLSELDPLDGAVLAGIETDPVAPRSTRAEALDRLYRPQALDVPVMVARDAPIATLDPREIGNFTGPEWGVPRVAGGPDDGQGAVPEIQLAGAPDVPVPQVVEAPAPRLQMVAVRESWVRIRAADGTVIFEGIMAPGDAYEPPLTEEPPTLRTGESGAIYFVMGGEYFGPVGSTGTVTSNVALSVDGLKAQYDVADLTADAGLTRYAEAQAQGASEAGPVETD